MAIAKILWADDEIDNLQSQRLFLESKGYEVHTFTNGFDAIDYVKDNAVDVVLLDESMPGITGLETLAKIKEVNPTVPVVMITKNETENLMDDAIGSKIADYLIKPVNPNQILLSLKKILDKKKLESHKTTTGYQQEFRTIGMTLSDRLNWEEWTEVYRKLIFWELELQKTQDESMHEILAMQKQEANVAWSKFVERNYIDWLSGKDKNPPTLSHTL